MGKIYLEPLKAMQRFCSHNFHSHITRVSESLLSLKAKKNLQHSRVMASTFKAHSHMQLTHTCAHVQALAEAAAQNGEQSDEQPGKAVYQ